MNTHIQKATECMTNLDQKYIKEIKNTLKELFPICRSITGNGVRKTLATLQKITDFEIKEIPSGTRCYDWTIPDEWNISDAFIEDESGQKIVNFKQNNLHVVSYSIPIDITLSFNELKKHLHTLPNMPEAVPYRTTYYKKNWGFCISYEQFKKLDKSQNYKIKIDSTLKPGALTYGECTLKGKSKNEFLISTYCCHPSMANDNLSGLVLWTYLLRELKTYDLKQSFRFIVVPETIGSIAYLSKNEKSMMKIQGGFVITTTGGPGKFGYKKTYLGDHFIDKIVKETFNEVGLNFVTYPFDINGSDERQYSSPFFRIPIGTISKDKYYEYDFYHTSKDNLDFISAKNIFETLQIYFKVIMNINKNYRKKVEKRQKKDISNHNISNTSEYEITYNSLMPYCEPMLSKRGLFPTIGGKIKQKADNPQTLHIDRKYMYHDEKTFLGKKLDSILWLMFCSDGSTSIQDIARRTDLPLDFLISTASLLEKHNLLEKRKIVNKK